MIIFEGLDDALVSRVRSGDEAAEVELYQIMRKTLSRIVDQDTLHDAYAVALSACRRVGVSNISGYICQSLWYMRCAKIKESIGLRSLERSLELEAILAKRKVITWVANDRQTNVSKMRDPRAEQESMSRSIVLDELLSVLGSKGDTWKRGEALLRMDIDGSSKVEIQRKLKITGTAYRLLKNRSKERLIQLSRKIDRIGIRRTGDCGCH